ncbi:16S rRNA (uracil(1498)-N(3))-methyltransferase [Desulfovibrio sp. JY]|nr:16S rRNA (uracil(1498)-N(3))-methyltransferase [Desulfovibrio sp. JY]
MGRPDAFYIPPEAFGEPYVLTGGEAAHCAKVLRKKTGEIIRAFDGEGHEGLFRITTVSRDRVDLEVQSLAEVPLPATRLFLAAGFSRSTRRDFFLEKAVELGAAGIRFWQAAHSQGRMPDAPKDSWNATLVAAAKQCGAARLPELDVVPGGAAGLVAACSHRFDRRYLLWEAPGLDRRIRLDDVGAPGEALFVLGPEGGLTDAEARTFQDAGYAPVSLGERVLRFETAALAVLALGLAAPPLPAPSQG